MAKKITELHPQTIISLQNGHPWVTKDKFSEKFPDIKPLIKLYHPEKGEFLGNFINDKQHPRVVARFWSKEEKPDFLKELAGRFKNAIEKRKNLHLERENFYLVFGEADHLPGLYIQALGKHILIQYQARLWQEYEQKIIEILKKTFPDFHFWSQWRIPGEQKQSPLNLSDTKEEFLINEFGLTYKIKMNQNHDIGIYSDMSALRKELIPLFKGKKNVLNLYCYTGAFSLTALKAGAKVTSVDLSKKYMSWLEENISLNAFDSEKHISQVKSCQKAIVELTESGQSFDLIICDPPTFSTDGKKRTKAIDFYKKYTSSLLDLLNPAGIAVFVLNTHQLPLKKFKEVILKNSKSNKMELIKQLGLKEDCSPLAHFPEGNYLKCLVFKIKEKP